ncbi:MAG: hypothetical protein J5770_02790 [Bacteroidaceae bacterium]|nr:hypothetical protein [Bacteroidaceae bacterium]
MLALLSMGSSVFAQGTVNVPTVVRKAGPVKEVSVVAARQGIVKVELAGGTTYRDLQFDLTLPAGITVTTDGGVVKDAAAQHTVAFNAVSDQVVRFVVYNDGQDDNVAEKFTDGIIVEIPVEVAADFTGEKPAKMDGILTSDDEARTSIALADANFNIRAVILGDVNDDGNVTNSDQVAIVMHLLDEPSTPFVFEAADMEYNAANPNEITNADAISLADKLLSSSAKEFVEDVVSDVETEIEPD